MIVQAPALFETLTGVKIGDLMARVPGLVDVVAAPVVTGPTDVPRNGGEPARESQ
jgi:hypothetical protein